MVVRLINFVMGCLLSYIFLAESALAVCVDNDYKYEVTFPSTLRISSVPIGGVLAQTAWQSPLSNAIRCDIGDILLYEEKTGMEMSGIPGVYKTNVEGIGMRFLLGNRGIPLPFSRVFSRSGSVDRTIVIELVRIGAGVGKERIESDLHIEIGQEGGGASGKVATYKGKLSFDVIGNNYMMCSAGNLSLDVQLGRFFVGQVKSGSAAPKSFSFDVSCTGVPAGKPLPVKVYFVGDSPSAGTLNLSGRGGSGVAKGVVIGLENDKGVALPFDRANAVPIEWQNSQPLGEVYRFNGLAKYIPRGGDIQPGVANAVMTMVLEYN
ncbi:MULTISPECIES: fimbrial protein [unclassified Pseudomonas]|uniref:fimbrial protein n=1 Tax=unclassified Pseudomonas TaxID=196821 RepID=UPI000F55B8F2|nr:MULTISPECIES: fimbrial protein [unclassified Pseudomonas]AZF03593.1 hypothetical protein C4J94_0807 [Pseudomonas sp. R5-89-07]AZF46065.1 hypothetical protein C4J86_0812 [Pseudomonas sp. R2-7-07]